MNIKVLTVYLIFLPIFCQSQGIEEYLRNTTLRFLNIVSETPAQCINDLEKFVIDLLHGKLWALRMLDASSKINPGLLIGNTYHFGNYDECLNLVPKFEKDKVNITGQYCGIRLVIQNKQIMEYLNLPKFYPVDVFQNIATLCMPESCSIEHINQFWLLLKEILYFLPFDIILKEESCLRRNNNFDVNTVDVCIYLFLGFIIGLVIVSTFYDVIIEMVDGKPNNLIIFSAYNNFKRLISSNVQEFPCLNGVKVLSIMWIILGQLAKTKTLAPNTNTLYIASEWIHSTIGSFALSSHYAADTFFLISGLLITYNFLKKEKASQFNIIYFYLNRLLKLVPGLLVVIFIYISFIKHLSSGPLWDFFIKENMGSCYKNWWYTMLFYNNNISDSNRCVQQTWYLSLTMQFYFLAPIFLWSIKKYPTTTIMKIISMIFINMAYTYTITHTKKLGCSPYLNSDYRNYILYSITTHTPSFLIGGLTGYLIYKKVNIPKYAILWILAISTLCGLITFNNSIFIECVENSSLAVLFNSLSRPLWCLSIAYIICNCIIHGGIIDIFLSNYVFRLLSPLTYYMFLSYTGFISGMAGNRHVAGTFSNFALFYEFCGTFAITLIIAVQIFIITEAPVLAIREYFKQKVEGKEKTL